VTESEPHPHPARLGPLGSLGAEQWPGLPKTIGEAVAASTGKRVKVNYCSKVITVVQEENGSATETSWAPPLQHWAQPLRRRAVSCHLQQGTLAASWMRTEGAHSLPGAAPPPDGELAQEESAERHSRMLTGHSIITFCCDVRELQAHPLPVVQPWPCLGLATQSN
jgi:hypothetical protein